MTSVATAASPPSSLTLQRVAAFWWPLAASWILMGSELPAVSAVMARLADPEIHLGAYGVVFSLALIVEAPIIMMLAASTALSKDWDSYVKLRRFMMGVSAGMTALHVLVAFTPLYDVAMIHIIGLPAELMEPARIGLRIMTPWTWAIAYRRANQGVLIRFDHTRAVGLGTVIRMTTLATMLTAGFLIGRLPGIVVGASSVIAGVLAEALYVGLRVRPVLRDELKAEPAANPPLDFREMLSFYVPLALTSFIVLIVNPAGAAALARSPMPIESLAVWPVMSGLVFIHRSLGVAFNEVVVALAERPGGPAALRRFTFLLTAVSTLPLIVIAATPLATVWFGTISGLSPELVALAQAALPFSLPMPALQAWLSYHQGRIMVARQTRSITESVVLFMLVAIAVLWAGVAWGQAAGVFVGWTAFSMGTVAQAAWLWIRARQAVSRETAEAVPALAA